MIIYLFLYLITIINLDPDFIYMVHKKTFFNGYAWELYSRLIPVQYYRTVHLHRKIYNVALVKNVYIVYPINLNLNFSSSIINVLTNMGTFAQVESFGWKKGKKNPKSLIVRFKPCSIWVPGDVSNHFTMALPNI